MAVLCYACGKPIKDILYLFPDYSHSVCKGKVELNFMEDSPGILPSLTDFDWQLSLALSSDKMDALDEHLVNLDLILKNGDNDKYNSSLEMGTSGLQILIEALESASKYFNESGS